MGPEAGLARTKTLPSLEIGPECSIHTAELLNLGTPPGPTKIWLLKFTLDKKLDFLSQLPDAVPASGLETKGPAHGEAANVAATRRWTRRKNMPAETGGPNLAVEG